jgi:S1-C subfamily serine protease
VESGSPAEAAGIKTGDILMRVEKTTVTSNEELETALYSYSPGDTVKLMIYRNGKQYSVTVTLSEAQK